MKGNNNLLNEDDIKELINDALYHNGLISDEIYEKCGKPKHIQSLPGDLRTNDIDLLCDRFDACKTEMRRLGNELKDMEKELSSELKDLAIERDDLKEGLKELGDMAIENQKFFDADDKVKEDKINLLEDIIERAGESNIYELDDTESIDRDILKVKDYLKDSSWIDKEGQDFINNLSDRVHKLANDLAEDDDGDISFYPIHEIANDLLLISSNDYFDKNLPKLHDNLHSDLELLTALDNVDKLQISVNKRIDKVEDLGVQMEVKKKKYMDFQDESLNTVMRAGNLGLLD